MNNKRSWGGFFNEIFQSGSYCSGPRYRTKEELQMRQNTMRVRAVNGQLVLTQEQVQQKIGQSTAMQVTNESFGPEKSISVPTETDQVIQEEKKTERSAIQRSFVDSYEQEYTQKSSSLEQIDTRPRFNVQKIEQLDEEINQIAGDGIGMIDRLIEQGSQSQLELFEGTEPEDPTLSLILNRQRVQQLIQSQIEDDPFSAVYDDDAFPSTDSFSLDLGESFMSNQQEQETLATEHTSEMQLSSLMLSEIRAQGNKTKAQIRKIIEKKQLQQIWQQQDQYHQDCTKYLESIGFTSNSLLLPQEFIEDMIALVYMEGPTVVTKQADDEINRYIDEKRKMQQDTEQSVTEIDQQLDSIQRQQKLFEVRNNYSALMELNRQYSVLMKQRNQLLQITTQTFQAEDQLDLTSPAYYYGMSHEQFCLNQDIQDTEQFSGCKNNVYLMNNFQFNHYSVIKQLEKSFLQVIQGNVKKQQEYELYKFMQVVEWIDQTYADKTTAWFRWFVGKVSLNMSILSQMSSYETIYRQTLHQRSYTGLVSQINYKIQYKLALAEDMWNDDQPMPSQQEQFRFHNLFVAQIDYHFTQQRQQLKLQPIEEHVPLVVRLQRSANGLQNVTSPVVDDMSYLVNAINQEIRRQFDSLLQSQNGLKVNQDIRSQPLLFHVTQLVRDIRFFERQVKLLASEPGLVVNSICTVVEQVSVTSLLVLQGLLNPDRTLSNILTRDDPLIFNTLKQTKKPGHVATVSAICALGLVYDMQLVFMSQLTHRIKNLFEGDKQVQDIQRLKLEAAEVCLRVALDQSELSSVEPFDSEPLEGQINSLHEYFQIAYCDPQLGHVMSDVIRSSLGYVNTASDFVFQSIFSNMFLELGICSTQEDSLFFYQHQCQQDTIQLLQRGGIDKDVSFNSFVMSNTMIDKFQTVLKDLHYQACAAAGHTMLAKIHLIYLDISTRFLEVNKIKGKQKTEQLEMRTIDFFNMIVDNPQQTMRINYVQLHQKFRQNNLQYLVQALEKGFEDGNAVRNGKLIFGMTMINELQQLFTKNRLVNTVLVLSQMKKNVQASRSAMENSINQIKGLYGIYERNQQELSFIARSVQPRNPVIPDTAVDPRMFDLIKGLGKQLQQLQDSEFISKLYPDQQKKETGMQYVNRIMATFESNEVELQRMDKFVSTCLTAINSTIKQKLQDVHHSDYLVAVQQRSYDILMESYNQLSSGQQEKYQQVILNLLDADSEISEHGLLAISKLVSSSGIDGGLIVKQMNKCRQVSQEFFETLNHTLEMRDDGDLMLKKIMIIMRDQKLGQMSDIAVKLLDVLSANAREIFSNNRYPCTSILQLCQGRDNVKAVMTQQFLEQLLAFQTEQQLQFFTVQSISLIKKSLEDKTLQEVVTVVSQIDPGVKFSAQFLTNYTDMFVNKVLVQGFKLDQQSNRVVGRCSQLLLKAGLLMSLLSISVYSVLQNLDRGRYILRSVQDYSSHFVINSQHYIEAMLFNGELWLNRMLGGDSRKSFQQNKNLKLTFEHIVDLRQQLRQILEGQDKGVDSALYLGMVQIDGGNMLLRTEALVDGSIYSTRTTEALRLLNVIEFNKFNELAPYESLQYQDDLSDFQGLRLLFETTARYARSGVRLNSESLPQTMLMILNSELQVAEHILDRSEQKRDKDELSLAMIEYLKLISIENIKQGIEVFSLDSPMKIADRLTRPRPPTLQQLEVIERFKQANSNYKRSSGLPGRKFYVDTYNKKTGKLNKQDRYNYEAASRIGYVQYTLGLNTPEYLSTKLSLMQINESVIPPHFTKSQRTLAPQLDVIKPVDYKFGSSMFFEQFGFNDNIFNEILNNPKTFGFNKSLQKLDITSTQQYREDYEARRSKDINLWTGVKAAAYVQRQASPLDTPNNVKRIDPETVYQAYQPLIERYGKDTFQGQLLQSVIETPIYQGSLHTQWMDIGMRDIYARQTKLQQEFSVSGDIYSKDLLRESVYAFDSMSARTVNPSGNSWYKPDDYANFNNKLSHVGSAEEQFQMFIRYQNRTLPGMAVRLSQVMQHSQDLNSFYNQYTNFTLSQNMMIDQDVHLTNYQVPNEMISMMMLCTGAYMLYKGYSSVRAISRNKYLRNRLFDQQQSENDWLNNTQDPMVAKDIIATNDISTKSTILIDNIVEYTVREQQQVQTSLTSVMLSMIKQTIGLFVSKAGITIQASKAVVDLFNNHMTQEQIMDEHASDQNRLVLRENMAFKQGPNLSHQLWQELVHSLVSKDGWYNLPSSIRSMNYEQFMQFSLNSQKMLSLSSMDFVHLAKIAVQQQVGNQIIQNAGVGQILQIANKPYQENFKYESQVQMLLDLNQVRNNPDIDVLFNIDQLRRAKQAKDSQLIEDPQVIIPLQNPQIIAEEQQDRIEPEIGPMQGDLDVNMEEVKEQQVPLQQLQEPLLADVQADEQAQQLQPLNIEQQLRNAIDPVVQQQIEAPVQNLIRLQDPDIDFQVLFNENPIQQEEQEQPLQVEQPIEEEPVDVPVAEPVAEPIEEYIPPEIVPEIVGKAEEYEDDPLAYVFGLFEREQLEAENALRNAQNIKQMEIIRQQTNDLDLRKMTEFNHNLLLKSLREPEPVDPNIQSRFKDAITRRNEVSNLNLQVLMQVLKASVVANAKGRIMETDAMKTAGLSLLKDVKKKPRRKKRQKKELAKKITQKEVNDIIKSNALKIWQR